MKPKVKRITLHKAKKRLDKMIRRQSEKFFKARVKQIQEASLALKKRIESGEVDPLPKQKRCGPHIAIQYGGPQIGEVWNHQDGGSYYVIGRARRSVRIQRRPFGDSLAEPDWISINTFNRINTGLTTEN